MHKNWKRIGILNYNSNTELSTRTVFIFKLLVNKVIENTYVLIKKEFNFVLETNVKKLIFK